MDELERHLDEVMTWLGERKISFITASEEELEESYQNFKDFIRTYKKA